MIIRYNYSHLLRKAAAALERGVIERLGASRYRRPSQSPRTVADLSKPAHLRPHMIVTDRRRLEGLARPFAVDDPANELWKLTWIKSSPAHRP